MSQSVRGECPQDVVDILTWDHHEIIDLLDQIVSTSLAGDRRNLTDMLIAEVVRHAVAEELFVHPAVLEHLPGGAAEVERDRQEHEGLIRLMRELEDFAASDPGFLDRVRRLATELQQHATSEESDQFPRLRAHIPQARLLEMANKVQCAKRLAPTRRHPHTPHAELLHNTIGSGVGMIDRLRESLIGRSVD